MAAVLLAAAACGGAARVPLAQLAADADRYDGRDVLTSGRVVEFDEDDGALYRHFVIEDRDANRVQLLPDEAAEEHVGTVVEVRGGFEFDPSRGRLLHVEEIVPVGDDDRA